MVPKPPSYGSQEYWNHRFSSSSSPFEWLGPPGALDRYVSDTLSLSKDETPELLHIGCGTSTLSYHLSSHVKNPSQIHNLDYSQIAIDLGIAKEINLRQHLTKLRRIARIDSETTIGHMRWDAVDLLDYKSVLQSCMKSAYSLIIDKSTADSIACSDDVAVPNPYPLDISPWTPGNSPIRIPQQSIYPLLILAVNLALVTKPGSRWISLSYSEERFDFSHWMSISCGFLDPSLLWKIIGKYEMEKPTREVHDETTGATGAHQPKVVNWVYVLERTETPLYVKEE